MRHGETILGVAVPSIIAHGARITVTPQFRHHDTDGLLRRCLRMTSVNLTLECTNLELTLPKGGEEEVAYRRADYALIPLEEYEKLKHPTTRRDWNFDCAGGAW